jgi:acetyl-CoA acetyltransferase
MAVLLADLPVEAPGSIINRLCGSGWTRWAWRPAPSAPATPT